MSPNQNSPAGEQTVVLLNCSTELLSRLDVPVYDVDDADKAADVADAGRCVAVKAAPWLNSLIEHGIKRGYRYDDEDDGIDAGTETENQLKEIKRMAAALEEMNNLCQELEETNAALSEQSKCLFDRLLERSPVIPSLDSSCVESLTQVDKYVLGDVVGRGTTGTIRSCVSPSEGAETRSYAIKIFDKRAISTSNGFEALELEIKAMRQLQSPKILRLFEVINASDHVYLILERAQNDLFEFLQYFPNGVPAEITRGMAWQLLEALHAMHSAGIVHRDIKPENILVNVDAGAAAARAGGAAGAPAGRSRGRVEVKLADFGTVLFAEDGGRATPATPAPAAPAAGGARGQQLDAAGALVIGSVGFMAPEAIGNSSLYEPRGDVWGFGVTLLELVFGSAVFKRVWLDCFAALPSMTHFQKMQDSTVDALCRLRTFLRRGHGRARLSASGLHLLESALQPNPAVRRAAAELLQHPWFSDPEPGPAVPPPAVGPEEFLGLAEEAAAGDGAAAAAAAQRRAQLLHAVAGANGHPPARQWAPRSVSGGGGGGGGPEGEGPGPEEDDGPVPAV